jgi:hypothetical protein
MNKIYLFLTVIIIFILSVIALWTFVLKGAFNSKFNLSSAAVIKEVRSLQRLETASFTIEKIIDGGNNNDNIFSQLLFGDKILLIAHGQVIAGFDLSQMSEKDIKVTGTSLTLTLPKPQILVATLDNTQTRVYDRQKGLLNPGSKDLESEARLAAEQSIRKAACDGDILKQASDNAKKQLTSLFSALGFTEININIPSGAC